MIVTEFHYLNERQTNLMLDFVAEKPKYKVLILLMLDAGMRVSEACSLKLKNFHFREKIVRVRTLKKRNETYRDIPLSARLLNSLADYLPKLKGDKEEPEQYLFPSVNGHLKRVAVWRMLDRIKKKCPQLQNLHPHALRHTFATRLVNSDVSLLTVKELLGHNTIATTEIYTHIPAQVLKNSIEKIEPEDSWLKKAYRFVTGKKKNVQVIRLGNGSKGLLVGREAELLKVNELTERKVNMLIKGHQGSGKTQLLDNLKIEGQKVARFDEIKNVKQSLVNFALHILNDDKKQLKELLYQDDNLEVKLNRSSTKHLIDLLIKITEVGEYTVIVDDVTNITPGGVVVLEKMRNHFHLICAARNVKMDKATFLTNFEIIDLDNLKRADTLELIRRLSYDIMSSIEDYELYQNHVWEQTNGNPQFVYEIIERYRKEDYIANETVREIRHTASMMEWDMTPIVLVGLASLMVLRYFGREIGESGYQLIGGSALIFALFARQFFTRFRRRFV